MKGQVATQMKHEVKVGRTHVTEHNFSCVDGAGGDFSPKRPIV